MTGKVVALACDLAVAVVSIVLFVATPVWLAMHQISSFHAIFLMIGSALAGVIAILGFRHNQEPWPIRIFTPVEMPSQKAVRPTLGAWIRSLDWTDRAQRA